MNEHPSGAHQLAERVLRHETGEITGPGATARALESAWRQLSDGLEPLLGRDGADALIARAVNLAGREFAFLGTPRTTPGARADFSATCDSLKSQEAAQAEAAGIAVLERLLGCSRDCWERISASGRFA
jgi:hypothetical protein